MPGRLSPAAPEGTPRPTDRLPWADVLASISDGVIVLDADGILYDLNPAAEQLTGVAASQGVGLRLEQLVEGRPTNAWLAELAQATLREGLARRRSEDRLRARGEEVAVSAASAPIHDEQGVVRGAVLVLHDLTLERALDATTRRADRLVALGTVASRPRARDRNPLGGIKGAAQLPRRTHRPSAGPRHRHHHPKWDRPDGLVEQLRGPQHTAASPGRATASTAS
jgi:PAS domain S-box-containing protein